MRGLRSREGDVHTCALHVESIPTVDRQKNKYRYARAPMNLNEGCSRAFRQQVEDRIQEDWGRRFRRGTAANKPSSSDVHPKHR